MASSKNQRPRTPLPPKEGAAQNYVTSEQATKALGIKSSSLYSYVSRGLIRSIVQPGARSRLYYREDVERATKRIGGRAGMPETVEGLLSWGQPVFHTAITDLAADGPVYRGRSAIALATGGRRFESVAELLWSGIDLPQLTSWDPHPMPSKLVERMGATFKDASALSCLRIMSLATTLVAISGQARPDFERGSTIPDARALLHIYTGALGFLGPRRRFVMPSGNDQSIAEIFLSAVGGPKTPLAIRAIDAALILCADHELSPGTLAARIAASCGAELRACLLAAIATHSGTLLSNGCDQSESLLRGADNADEMHRLMAGAERDGGRIPGYNLRPYPKGDPRARTLLDIAEAVNPRASRINELVATVEERFDLKPSLEVGLVAVSAALDLPPRLAAAIWALGRVAGWVAHVIEQRQAGFMVRPRARYIGPGA